MKIKSLSQVANLQGKTVFVRVDFNVPVERGRIKDDYKIRAGLATLEFLSSQGARVVVATHLGEPHRVNAAYSVKPIAVRLRRLLKRPVKFVPEVTGLKVSRALAKLQPGEFMMIENLRFAPGEYTNDQKFAAQLAQGIEVYVNDAFAVCHRNQASVAAIKQVVPAYYAGRLLEREVKALDRVLQPRKPLVVVMGGAKIKTKAPLIRHLHWAASHILLGGSLANNFFKWQKLEVGRSLVDADSLSEVKRFFKGKKLDPKIVLPIDVVVKNKQGQPRVVSPNQVKATDTILDIGPATIAIYADYIKQAQTLVWNGPLGKFEEASYKNGTLMIARFLAARSSGRAYGVVGGGETVEALQLTKMAQYVDWVSTAGGAMLSYLGGAPMPGLSQLVK
jgi:phosphoglycerate kinase